jgi:gamma-glutamylcyclotransferase (GGCT)/AIG2-like uncharacterized protein YtfP
MNPSDEITEFPIFTYGTLRPGQPLARMLERSLVPGYPPATVTVQGYALYANRSRTYPYLFAEEGATATGTLYMVRGDKHFMRVHQMELGAGYDTAHVVARGQDGREVEALAWEMRRPEYLGERIESGDWCQWSEHNFPNWSGSFSRG